jgi:hypothetical protein
MSAVNYRGHVITPVRLPNGNWKADVSRTDGRPIELQGLKHMVLSTMEYPDKEAAIPEAQADVDAIS